MDIEKKSAYPTSISSPVVGADSNSASKVYDLQGREVSAPLQKGLYIKDGKKVIMD